MFTAGIFNDTTSDLHFGCDLVMYQLTKQLSDIGIEVIWSWPVGEDWRPHSERILRRQIPDLILVNGEGSIHNSAERERAQYLPELVDFIKLNWGIPCVLVNATLYKLREREVNLIKKFDLISLRDSSSRAVIGYESNNVLVTGDLSLTFNFFPEASNKRIITGLVTDSVVTESSKALGEFAQRKNWRKLNFIHGGAPPKQILDESTLERNFLKMFNQSSGIALVHYFSLIEKILTARYHCVTLCLLSRTPFMAMASNTPKIEFLLNDIFGSLKRIYSTQSENEIIDFDSEEIRKIDDYICNVQKRYSEFFRRVKSLVVSQS